MYHRYGETEKELPRTSYPYGVYIFSIPGLCTGGNTDPRNAAMGFVTILRTKKQKLVKRQLKKEISNGTEKCFLTIY